MTSKPSTEIIDEINWMPLLSYLNTTPELLELGVKKANYPYVLNFQPLTNASQVVGTNNGTIKTLK
jgi:hypothetical protein